jgi:hypothetical protein
MTEHGINGQRLPIKYDAGLLNVKSDPLLLDGNLKLFRYFENMSPVHLKYLNIFVLA